MKKPSYRIKARTRKVAPPKSNGLSFPGINLTDQALNLRRHADDLADQLAYVRRVIPPERHNQ
jgi:hypothetical protein